MNVPDNNNFWCGVNVSLYKEYVLYLCYNYSEQNLEYSEDANML